MENLVVASVGRHDAAKPWRRSSFRKAARLQLPDASVSVEVAEEDQGVERITLQIEWESGAERARESVRLVGWKFLAEEEGP